MAKIMQSVVNDEVLDKVMRLFWRNGFANTSIEDITLLTGLNRAAIYKHFGGKSALFLSMLRRFRKQVTAQFVAPLQQANGGIERIHTFFSQFLALSESEDITDGCFLIATSSDLPSHEQEVIDFIADFLTMLRGLFHEALNAAKQLKQVPDNVDSQQMADFLVGNVFGIMTLFRANAPKPLLINHLTGVLNFLSTLSR